MNKKILLITFVISGIIGPSLIFADSVAVDLRVNNSDGPITIAYNASANLTWTSANANSCTASGDWSGNKNTSGSQSTGNLTASKTYTITCTGPDGSATDSVTVDVNSPVFSVALEAIPSAGCAPLNDVDLKAVVSGNYSGYITYFFDCTNDGNWDRIISVNSNNYQTSNLCDYSSDGNYTAKIRAENQSLSDEEIASINVYSCGSTPSVDIKANNSDGPITIGYNGSATLTWNAYSANSCSGSGNWSGSKTVSYGSESTGNLTSSKYYTITCSGSVGTTVTDSVWVNVSSDNTSGNIFVEESARNLSDGTGWANLIYANPGEIVSFFIRVRADGSNLTNVIITDTLPGKLIYQNNSLQVNGAAVSGNIFSGLNIGDLYLGQEKTITFNAIISPSGSFNLGQTQLVDTVLVSSLNNSNSKSATVVVTRTAVAGAATDVSTGITDNLLLDSFFLPLSAALGIIWFFKAYIINIQDWFYLKRKKYQQYSVKKVLELKIADIKEKESLKNK